MDALKDHIARSDRAWTERMPWDSLYQDVYDYVVPYRRPATGRHGGSQGAQRVEKIFDNTAVVSTFAGAGRLQADLFPPGQPFFTFTLGPVARLAMERGKIDPQEAKRELEQVAQEIQALFNNEFDQACLEMCVDLQAGFGAMIAFDGDDTDPVRFVCVPMDELALEAGPYGDVAAAFWKTRMTRRQISAAFPRGRFPDTFKEGLRKTPDAAITLRQDFVQAGRGWRMIVWCDDCGEADPPIADVRSKTRPIVTPRYHRVPGEAYGRGPAMLALPTIKTLNKAQELMLKSAAIQMLGLWAYRPGGAFNPETVRIAPGAFWPMGSTGGVMGPDVTRLDPAGGKMEIGQLVTQEMRSQLQAALNDDRLPDKGATPVSATEIMARMKRVSQNYVGAFGRLVNEIVPPLVRRVAEIADRRGLLSRNLMPLGDLLVKIDVTSPMAVMLKAQALERVLQWLQIVAQIKGPQAIELLAKVDDLLRELGQDMQVPARLMNTAEEQAAIEQKLAAAAAQMAAAQTAAAQAGQPADPAQAIASAA